jgi:hypothetical protein
LITPINKVVTIASTYVPPLSQSRQGLMACPHLYRERVILGKREASNEYAERGKQIHDVLARYLAYLVSTRQAYDHTQLEAMIEGVGSEAAEILRGMKESLQIDPEKVLGIELYMALNEQLEALDPDECEPFEVSHEGTPDLILAPDRTTAEIWDWKSYWQIIDPDTYQAKLYPLLVFKHYPSIDLVRFHLKFVRYGVTRAVEYTRADVPKLERLVLQERTRQQMFHQQASDPESFEAMPGSHCAWCPDLYQACPIAGMNPYNDMTPDDRAKFGLWIDQARSENNRILKDLVNARGPVVVSDGNGQMYAAELKLKTRRKLPLAETLVQIEKWETANPSDQLKPKLCIGSTELGPYLKAKKRAELAAAIEQIQVTTHHTEFGIGKVGLEED